jgi:hypothetical protein
MVRQLLNDRVEEGVLDESGLSLDDLAKIRDSFVPILAALFQGRVVYPGLTAVPTVPPRPSSGSTGKGEAAADAEPPEEEAGAS